MNMIRHHHESVQKVMAEHLCVVVDGLRYHVGQNRLAKVKGSRMRLLQQPIERGKLLPRTELGREVSLWRQAALKTPGQKDWPAHFGNMR